ncbi:MAG: hypothetical protein ACQERD_09715 [Campylobacterota bacterium]
MENRKIVVINNKGGVGKTTSANEIFAPFLSFVNDMNPTVVYEFDEENTHGKMYTKSDCVRFSSQKTTGLKLENAITDILLNEESCVIDIGANKSTTYFIDALEKSALDDIISLVAIPLSDGEQDTLNAKNIYRKIRKMNNTIPVLFVLSRHTPTRELEYQFDYFFEELLPIIDEKDQEWIVLNDSDCVKFSKREGKTIFELSYDNIDYKEMIKKAIKKNKSQEKIKKLSHKHKMNKELKDYRNDILIPAFNKIKEIINRDLD